LLVDQLSTAFRCHCAIGNSIDLKEMIDEVLKTFINESYAFYGHFCLRTEEMTFENFHSFGKKINFDFTKYVDYKDELSIIKTEQLTVLKMILDNGIIFLVSKNLDVDCSFFLSMFESLIPKLNLSIKACLNHYNLNKANLLLNEQKKELINANKIKDDFLANMSHELKTPLNSISIISKIMSNNKDNKFDDMTVKNMKIINKCAQDLTEIINDILDISKIEAGELNISKICVTSEMGVGSIFRYVIYKKSNESIVENNNKTEIHTKETSSLFEKDFLEKQIYLLHSNSIEQFTITVNLKRHGLNIIPVLNENKLKEKIGTINNDNSLIILDSINQNIINDEEIKKLNLIILEEGESIENLIEKLKNTQNFKEDCNHG
jgi:two-component system chemotaxis sensor kinase CheA